MALHCTMTFYGEDGESLDHQKKWYHYLVVASPGELPGSAVASIITVADAQSESTNAGEEHRISTAEGGLEASLKQAQEYLIRHHPGLKRIMSRSRS